MGIWKIKIIWDQISVVDLHEKCPFYLCVLLLYCSKKFSKLHTAPLFYLAQGCLGYITWRGFVQDLMHIITTSTSVLCIFKLLPFKTFFKPSRMCQEMTKIIPTKNYAEASLWGKRNQWTIPFPSHKMSLVLCCSIVDTQPMSWTKRHWRSAKQCHEQRKTHYSENTIWVVYGALERENFDMRSISRYWVEREVGK